MHNRYHISHKFWNRRISELKYVFLKINLIKAIHKKVKINASIFMRKAEKKHPQSVIQLLLLTYKLMVKI